MAERATVEAPLEGRVSRIEGILEQMEKRLSNMEEELRLIRAELRDVRNRIWWPVGMLFSMWVTIILAILLK